jgi:arylamine N-acetyltransferase
MSSNPLQSPTPDSRLLPTFLRAFEIDKSGPALDVLERVGRAFARLPYENLTKIIRQAETGTVAEARRGPSEVLSDHLQFGSGGTCFSLTATLLHLVRALGFEAQPILADRPYGANTHCALLVWIEGQPHLLDPGFLITRPVFLPQHSEFKLQTRFNDIILAPTSGGEKVDLITLQGSQRTPRITFKTQPVDADEFLKVWDASFDWDMMKYPLLTRVSGNQQLYLHGNRLQVRDRTAVQRGEIDPETLVERIAQEFGVAPEIVRKALTVLKRKGEHHGASGGA